MTPEAKIERACARLAKDYGCWMPKWTSPGTAGVPDRILLTPHGVVFVEFKAPGRSPTRLQAHYLDKLRGYNQKAVVIDSVDAFKKLLRSDHENI